VNREDFAARLRALWEALADLEGFAADVSREDLLTDRRTQLMVLHALFIASQSTIDLALQAVKALEIPSDGTYRDAFRGLATAGQLDAELTNGLQGWASFRNVVAHFYPVIDFDRVFDALHQRDDLAAFADWARGFLAAEE